MATSGVYSEHYTTNDIGTAALRKLGVIASGQTPTPQNLIDTQMALNMLVAMLKAEGMPIWARSSYTFSPVNGVSTYTIGTGRQFDTPYPVKVLQVYRTTDGTRIDMDVEADYNFNQLPPNSSGTPLKLTYQANINYGTIQLWPIPDAGSVNSTFTIVYQRPFQYFSNSGDYMDFPEEWYLPMVYKLAVLIAPEWGVPLPDRQKLEAEADKYLDKVLSMGQEDASMFIQPYRPGSRGGLS